jgi:SAM-dependent methyltransferase
MSWIDDQKHLREVQYRTPQRLNARFELHRRFSQQTEDFLTWTTRMLPVMPGQRSLDVGCGPARLWQTFAELPNGVQVMLADFSAGMIGTACHALKTDRRFGFVQADVQTLPMSTATFDGVVANHMLYHVPDIGRAVAELGRVLKPKGWLCTACNGVGHVQEIYQLASRFTRKPMAADPGLRYSLENGADFLAELFTEIRVLYHAGNLWVTEAQPLVDYILTIWSEDDGEPGWVEQLLAEIEGQIARFGGVQITRSTGLILARRR